MSIQDALERARKLGLERAAAKGEFVEPEPAQSVPKRRSVDLPSPTVMELPSFELIRHDLKICEERRILVPVDGFDRLTAIASDSYRILRTRLLHRMKTKGWMMLGVTSPGPGEGKSVTCINLALSMAREKVRNIFLIDLDMRSPSVCPYLGIEPITQMSHFFMGEVGVEKLLFSTGIDNLFLAGGTISNAQSSELLATAQLDRLIRYIKSIDPNGLIMIDLPPVLNTADVLVVAPHLDAMLMVATIGRTRRDALESAIEVLKEFPLVGLVLNRSAEAVVEYYGS